MTANEFITLIDGLAMAREIVARHPGVPIIYTSGSTPTDGMRVLFVEGAAFIQKPYTMRELGELIRRMLPVAAP